MPLVVPIDAGVHVEWAGFRGGDPVFALADGIVVIGGKNPRRVAKRLRAKPTHGS